MRLDWTAMLDPDVPTPRATPGSRERLLGLLIEYHGLVIELRTAKPRTAQYHQLLRREAEIQRRIHRITAL